MVGRGPAGRRKAASVAGRTLVSHRHLAMVPGGWLPPRCIVAADAIHTGRNVRTHLAGGGTAIVATRAIGGAVEQAVVGLGARPGTGRFVAVLAHRLATVDGGGRASGDTETGAHVTGRALR